MRYVYPYKKGSKSAKNLAEEMDVDRIGVDVQLMRGRPTITVVNWGSGDLPEAVKQCRVLNKQDAVNKAVNKRTCFQALSDANVRTPTWTTSIATAQSWYDDGTPVVARTKLEGKDGDGLILCKERKTNWFGKALPLPDAKLYTQFIKAKAEYRINVCGDRTMGVQKKVPIEDNHNEDIKTGGNGYGFKLLNENEIPKGIRPVARAAIAALGLDFGGVDLIVGVDGNPYVLEVNTAPELTPSMVKAYARKLETL